MPKSKMRRLMGLQYGVKQMSQSFPGKQKKQDVCILLGHV